jgi:hypothetical protein
MFSCHLLANDPPRAVRTEEFRHMSTIQYVTVAQALASQQSALNVLDSGANIAAALPNLERSGRVATFSLNASGTVTAVALSQLAALPNFYLNNAQLTVSDAAFALLSAASGLFTDKVSNIPGGPANVALVAHTVLTGSPTLLVSQLAKLEALPGFSIAAGDHVVLSDSMVNIAGALAAHPAWFNALSSIAVRLDGTHVGAYAAAQLGLLAAHGTTLTFTSTGTNTTLPVTAAAHDIAANSAGLADLAGKATISYTLTNPGVAIDAADAAVLAGLAGFNPGAQILPVSDTGANISAHAAALFGHGFSAITVSSGNFAGTSGQLLNPALAVAAGATVSLGTTATVTEAVANSLAALAGFTVAQAASLIVQDSAANLLNLSNAAQIAATSLQLNGPQNVTVQQLAGLAALGSKFSDAGSAVSVQGSAAALEGLSGAALALATQINVQDTAANLAAAASHQWGSIHPSYTLSQAGTATAAQATVLAGLGSAFSLNGQALSVADTAANVVANSAALGTLGIHATVTDTVAGISANQAALVALGTELTGVTISDPNPSTASIAAALAPLAAKFSAGAALTVSDTASNINANITALDGIAAIIGTHLTLQASGTAAQIGIYAAAFGHSGATVAITLTDQAPVLSAVAAALAPLAGDFVPGTNLAVTDTVGAVITNAAALASLSAALGTVTMSGLGTAQTAANAASLAPFDSHLAVGETVAVADTAANLAANSTGLLQLLHDGRLLGVADLSDTVAGVTANAALLNSLNANVAIIDTALHVAAAIDALAQIHGLSHVTLSDAGTPTLVLSVAQTTNDGAVLSAITGQNYTVTLTDTAAALQTDLTSANSVIVSTLLASKLLSIVSTSGPITLTLTQLQAAHIDTNVGDALHDYAGALNVTGVPYASIAGLASLPKAPTTISVGDTAANINSNLTAILFNPSIVGLTVTDGGTLALSSVAQIAPVTALLTQPASMSITDTASDIQTDLASAHSALLAELINHPGAITALHVTGGTISLTAAATLMLANANELVPLATLLQGSGTPLNITVNLATLPSVTSLASSHITITVSDTAAHLAGDLTSGNSVLQHDSTSVSGVVLVADPIQPAPTLSASAMSALYTYGFTNPNSVALPVADTVANTLAVDHTTQGALALADATSVTVNDTSANVAANLAAINTAKPGFASLHITLSDTAPAITVTYANYSLYAATLDTITNRDPIFNRGPVFVTDTAANLQAHAGALLADTDVGKVTVQDTAANIETGSNLANLQTLGSLLYVNLTDAQLSASAITALLLQSAHLSTSGTGVADTAQAIANLVTTTPAAAAFLNSYGATAISVNPGGLTVVQMTALTGLTAFHAAGASLLVYDTAANLTGAGAAAVLASPLVSGVYLNATSHTATITAAQAVAMFSIPTFHDSDLSGVANVLTVQDSAAGIDAVHTQLAALAAQITGGIAVNASATITDAVLGDLQALGATATNGALLTVADTAANIANNAIAQTTGMPSITATNWQLTTSATVTEAQAVVLGGLGNLSTYVNGHQLAVIVSLPSNTVASASDAIALGNLHAALALNLNGHSLIITDTTAHLTGLIETYALTYVVPNATIVVNDTANTSEATAANFLTLLHNNNGGGSGGPITAGQLSFTHADTVVDTIANLQTFNTALTALTGVTGTGWTGNAALAAGFQLTAADTVANLINGSNTTFLSNLHATTLSTNAQTNATDAETLATLASQIHFSLGAANLTVTDTAANLLNSVNQAGLQLASTVELTPSGPVLDAADALSLLNLHNLVLTTNNPLVIQDTPANLMNSSLDALLASPAVAPYATVELSGSAPVTVQQAAILAALPSLIGTIHIADNSANLLNVANTTVVNGTNTTVALAGNETVSAATILGLSQLSNFHVGSPGGVLTLASNDTANQATAVAIASLGANFNDGGHTVTLTTNITVNAAQFEALQNDGVALNLHTITVSDTVANLAGLVTNAAWTNSVALHGSYQLVAADTVAGLSTLESSQANLVSQLYSIGLSQSDNTTTTNANALATVVAGTMHSAFNANGYALTVIGTNAADINATLTTGKALANIIQVNEAAAVTLLTTDSYVLNLGQTLLVSDTMANLLAGPGTLSGAIGSNSQISVQLAAGAGNVVVTPLQLGQLLPLPNFSVNNNTLYLTGSYFVATPAEVKQIADMGPNFQSGLYGVELGGNVSGLTALELINLHNDNLALNGFQLTVSDTAANILAVSAPAAAQAASIALSANATLTPTQLAALADLPNFVDGGHAITLTADALALTPTEYGRLQADGVLANQVVNGHVISAALAGVSVTDTNSLLSLTATGSIAGATVKVYDEHGNTLSSIREGHAGFTITAADPADHNGNGQAFAFTETVNGVESAPVVVLDQGIILAAVTAANATFANNNGDVQVGINETLHVYNAGDAALQTLSNPALIYDPHAHTVSLDIPGNTPVVLITLGAATDPATSTSLDVIVKHHG